MWKLHKLVMIRRALIWDLQTAEVLSSIVFVAGDSLLV